LGELDEIVPDDVFRDGFAAMAVPVEDLSQVASATELLLVGPKVMVRIKSEQMHHDVWEAENLGQTDLHDDKTPRCRRIHDLVDELNNVFVP
jgi:hypothetical protein